MKTVDPIKSVTVNLGERQITLSRSELDRDETLKELISDFDVVRQEIADVDFQRRKLTHSFLGMQLQLNKRAEKFAQDNYGEPVKERPDTKESNDGKE